MRSVLIPRLIASDLMNVEPTRFIVWSRTRSST
jgi:hypothetical protein